MEGLEPSVTVLETVGLPLTDTPVIWRGRVGVLLDRPSDERHTLAQSIAHKLQRPTTARAGVEVPSRGFEPRHADSESAVLPLD